jgi:hypothetical protein
LLVGELLHPADGHAVLPFLDGDVDQGGGAVALCECFSPKSNQTVLSGRPRQVAVIRPAGNHHQRLVERKSARLDASVRLKDDADTPQCEPSLKNDIENKCISV